MHVPVSRRERSRKGDLAEEDRQPDQHGHAAVNRREQEERPETIGEDGGTTVLADAGDRCHGFVELRDAPGTAGAAFDF
jgi:hypothetical protein